MVLNLGKIKLLEFLMNIDLTYSILQINPAGSFFYTMPSISRCANHVQKTKPVERMWKEIKKKNQGRIIERKKTSCRMLREWGEKLGRTNDVTGESFCYRLIFFFFPYWFTFSSRIRFSNAYHLTFFSVSIN